VLEDALPPEPQAEVKMTAAVRINVEAEKNEWIDEEVERIKPPAELA